MHDLVSLYDSKFVCWQAQSQLMWFVVCIAWLVIRQIIIVQGHLSQANIALKKTISLFALSQQHQNTQRTPPNIHNIFEYCLVPYRVILQCAKGELTAISATCQRNRLHCLLNINSHGRFTESIRDSNVYTAVYRHTQTHSLTNTLPSKPDIQYCGAFRCAM